MRLRPPGFERERAALGTLLFAKLQRADRSRAAYNDAHCADLFFMRHTGTPGSEGGREALQGVAAAPDADGHA